MGNEGLQYGPGYGLWKGGAQVKWEKILSNYSDAWKCYQELWLK